MTIISYEQRKSIEAALDCGKLYSKRLGWKCRRNGQTKLWKTRPAEFSIPVKAGFKATGYITHSNFENDFEIRN